MTGADVPATAREAREAAFPRCPTPCDDDCEQACHEVHEVPSHRDHNPETCVAAIVAAARQAGWAAALEWAAQQADGLKFRLYRPAKDGPGGGTHALDVVPAGELLKRLGGGA